MATQAFKPVSHSTAPLRLSGMLRNTGVAIAVGGASAAMAAFAGLSLWYGGLAAWSDAGSLQARWSVNAWREGTGPAASPAQWLAARDDLQAALHTAPNNAQLLDDLGFLHASRAQALGTPAAGSAVMLKQQSLLADAIVSYRASTSLRPTFPYSWAYLALAKHLLGQRDAEFWLAFDKALHYGHAEAGVQPALAQMAFADWPALGGDRQNRLTRMVSTAPAASRKRLLDMAAQGGVTLPGS